MIRAMRIVGVVLGTAFLAPASARASSPTIPLLPEPLEKIIPYVGPLIKFLPLVLDPGDISGKRHAEVVSLYAEGQAKLVVASSTIQVVVKKTHEKWTGNYHLTMKIPCKISYALDLGSAAALTTTWDSDRKVLKVQVPAVQVYAIEPLLNQRQFSFKRTGLRWSSGGVEAQLREAALEDVDPEARRHAAAEQHSIQSQAADRFRQLVRAKLRLAIRDVEVAVESLPDH